MIHLYIGGEILKRFGKLGLFLFLGTMLLLSACSKNKEPQVFSMDEYVQFDDDLIVTINSIEDHPGEYYDQPSEGNIYKIVDFTIENIDDETVGSFTLPSMADSDGYIYDSEYKLFLENYMFHQKIPSGYKLNGQVAFEVPINAPDLVIMYTDVEGNGPAIWSVE